MALNLKVEKGCEQLSLSVDRQVEKFPSKLKLALKGIQNKHLLFYYTFIALLFKSIIFLGFTLDSGHLSFNFVTAFLKALPCLYYYLCFIAVLLSFSFLFKKSFRIGYLLFINILLSIILTIDLLYYRGFSTMPSLNLLQQTANLDNLSSSIFSFLHWIDLIFFVDIFILIPVSIFSKTLNKDSQRSILSFTILFIISVFIIGYVPVKVDVLKMKDASIFYFRLYDPNITIKNLSPLGYHVFNIYTFWKDIQPHKLSLSEKAEIEKWFTLKNENLPDNKYKSLLKGKNLIFIQIESFEKFVLNQKVFGQEVTPNLNSLLKNSLYFSHIREQVNSGQSSDADLMANTSVYPVRQGSTFFRYPYNTYNSLPLLLESLGYSTIALHPDKGSYWNWMPALKSFGFQQCIDSTQYKMDELIGMGISDGSFLRQVEPLLAKQKAPFYGFTVTLSSHAPFDLPEKYWKLKLNSNLDNTTLGGYFQSAFYVDEQIGIFIEKLRKENLLDNTAIVIYGDHCGVHKFYPKDIQNIKNPEPWWLDNHGEIPFIIYQNGLKGEEIKTIGGQIDFLPTIAYLMGVDEKSYLQSAMGRNLLKTERSFVVLKNRSYICDPNSEKYKEHALKGLDIADLIIRSNYFKYFNMH